MNLFADIRGLVLTTLDEMIAAGELPAGLATKAITVEPPRDTAHGDMATNAAMVLAKPAGKKPREIAELFADRIQKDPRIARVSVAGPGFLNLFLEPTIWNGLIDAINQDPGYGKTHLGQGQKVCIEFVSANPTGPLHVGHTRGAVFGDALASLLEFSGFDVTREYYINDGGAQVDVLARSVYLRYLEAHGRSVDFEDGTYPGDYLIPVGEALKETYGAALLDAPEAQWLPVIRDFATDSMMNLIRHDLKRLGIEMDIFFSEKSLNDSTKIETAIESLRAKGLIYRGTLEPPKGKLPEDWEAREQTLFKSTAFGDDVDRPIMKSDGSWTYFAPDIAYHHDKLARGYDLLIDVLGADHGGYVKRIKAAVAAMSDDADRLDVKLTQLVKLYKDGAPYKMSKRAGTFVTLADVVEQVGPDVTRFHMLTRKNDAPLDFDFDKVTEQSKDNPVFYVQYANARINSVLRKAAHAQIISGVPDISHPAEIAVAQKLADFPRQIAIATRNNEPHRVAFYLYELAASFHALYKQGNEIKALAFFNVENPQKTATKMPLAAAVGVVIRTGLAILGVEPVEEM